MAFRTNKTPVLQTKSASGSVATFNTALAMPLPSCNIAVNAWQEGSGDPSPVNKRTIHGWTESNLANMSDSTKVQFFKGLLNGTYGFVDLGTLMWDKAVVDDEWIFRCAGFVTDYNGVNGTNLPSMPNLLCKQYVTHTTSYQTIPPNKNMTMGCPAYFNNSLLIHDEDYSTAATFKTAMSGVYLIYELATPTTPTITKAQFEMLLNAFGISGELYTIQFGQEVYGAEVDVVNGVLHVTHEYLLFDGSENGWRDVTYYGMRSAFINNVLPSNENRALGISNMSKDVGTRIQSSGAIWVGVNNKEFDWIGILDTLDLTIEQFRTWLNSHNLQVAYKLTTPFDIQLTPTQIETLIGNNTIFADTGDIDLTFKDLDIAKRGNFREVFKLPS